MTRIVLIICLLVIAMQRGPAFAADKPQRLLLIGQAPDGHPPGTHEYRAAASLFAKMLAPMDRLQTIVVSADGDWSEGPELLDGADAAVVFVSEGAKWLQADAKRLAAFQALAKRGGGLICLHWGMGTREAKFIPAWVELFGGCHGGPDRRYKVVDVKTQLATPSHPILQGVSPVEVHEEFYFKLKWAQSAEPMTPLIQVRIEEEDHTVGWAWERPDGGRSFGFSGLHFHENWKLESYRRMLAQSVRWVLKREIPQAGVKVNLEPADFVPPPQPDYRKK
ncbi:MAG: ThuA domain-containing protein [Planctomycetota bacterium]|nr:ThuA domain-containing protein [Planctomycetota bacterium]MDA0918799.1 ThuA domain-containing protein [Planctomycetota bacterium]MDA1159458.1 ThuA domain-containing protein [Planctomycetota bacterium]